MIRKAIILLLIILVIVSCTRSRISMTEKEQRDRLDKVENDETRFTLNVHTGNNGELNYARNATSKGDYNTAVKVYLRLEKDKEVTKEKREEVLYNLGILYDNFMYSKKNSQKSYDYLSKLLEEFPETKYKSRAEEKIENLKQTL